MLKSLAKICAALLAFSAWCTAAHADIFRAAEFTLSHGEENGTFEFTAAIPDAVSTPKALGWPEGCSQTSASHTVTGSTSQYSFAFRCDHPLRTDDVIQTPWQVDGASFISYVTSSTTTRSLAADADGIAVPIGEVAATSRPLAKIATEYLKQGVVHIWMGWDHLAFVLCLCMLASGRKLVGLVTAFTIGHSASLTLAFLDVVHVPIPPVEAVIALSIAFMAREALMLRDGMRRGKDVYRREMAIVITFGLLHGLGFASALHELGVQAGERVPALIFFNIGVEAGQLVFVGAVLALMAALRTVSLAAPVRVATSFCVGVLGFFWTIERVISFAQA